MTTLIIDAGHGGSDPGATAFATKEKDWNLKMSRYQHHRLTQLGAKVNLTRSTDQTLSTTQRTDKIKNKFNYCISNHFNAFNGTARGIETIHSIHANPQMASEIAHAIAKSTNLPLRRIFSRQMSRNLDWYFMHRLTGSTQTIIIEYGFLDNLTDFTFYQNEAHFYQAAEAVIKVLCPYLKIRYQPPTPTTPTKLYRVQTGAFTNKQNATQQVQVLKKAGFPAIITN